MKRLSIIAGLALAMLCSMGCSKFEDIFNGNDKDVISPISLSADSEEDVFSYEEVYEIASAILPDGWYKYIYGSEPGEPTAQATVINDDQIINDLVSKYDLKSRLSDADFSNCSIIAGYFITAMSNYAITKQRIKHNSKGIQLYLKIETAGDYGYASPTRHYFVTFYPQLPNGDVEVYRSDIAQ